MSGYLEGYGAGEERKIRLIKQAVGGLLALIVVAGVAYYYLRNYKEERQARQFVSLLSDHQYKAAYALWGCTDEKPCRDYPYDRFMEDWGPKSPHADMTKVKVVQTKSCSGGIIRVLRWEGQKEDVFLWVNRSDLVLSFSPWGAPVCSPTFRPNAGSK